MQIENELRLDFSDVLLRPKRSILTSRGEVDLHREFTFRNSKQNYNGIPVIAANMDTIGTFKMADALHKHEMSVAIHKHYTQEELIEYFKNIDNNEAHWYSMGITDVDLIKFNFVKFHTGHVRNVCVDVANGYQEVFVDFVKKFREDNPNTIIMAGNVVTGEMTEALILAGADIVKVGIGPGSVCTTRKMTGVGMPQLSAIIECADSAHGLGGHICADGGITCPGDLSKAFGAGADFVMMGGVFAGHDECEGEIIYEEYQEEKGLGVYTDENNDGSNTVMVTLRRPVKMKFYGMSSKEAMDKHSGGIARHRAAEGKCVEVPYRGSVDNTVLEYLGGLRSTCTYIGARKLKDMSKCTTFVRVNNQINNTFGKS